MLNNLSLWALDALQGKPTRSVNGNRRSPEWPIARKAHLLKEPSCQWCGSTVGVEVHHIVPFHVDPTLELQDSNFITLCDTVGGEKCHLIRGHNQSWRKFVPTVRQDCESHRTHPVEVSRELSPVSDQDQNYAGMRLLDYFVRGLVFILRIVAASRL